MSTLTISDLHASVHPDRGAPIEILRGVNLTMQSGEVHALMGPNGSGKSTLSHALMGRSGYEVTAGSITIDGQELVGAPTYERAEAGLFVAMQYPVEVPGVPVEALLTTALRGRVDFATVGARISHEADSLEIADEFFARGVNVEFSGGEKKRMETLQLAVLEPKFAILDEIDSGLDVDALRDVSQCVEAMTSERNLGVLAITHYARLLKELRPDFIHVLVSGRVVASGGPELADTLEAIGYEGLIAELGIDVTDVAPTEVDPFADPLGF
jgi:Fe-S cluster assembly ATP-binding protein